MSSASSRYFGLTNSGVGRGVIWGGDGERWELFFMNSKCICLDVKGETTDSNNWTGEPFRGHISMMSIKNDQFFDLLPPSSTNKGTVNG